MGIGPGRSTAEFTREPLARSKHGWDDDDTANRYAVFRAFYGPIISDLEDEDRFLFVMMIL